MFSLLLVDEFKKDHQKDKTQYHHYYILKSFKILFWKIKTLHQQKQFNKQTS